MALWDVVLDVVIVSKDYKNRIELNTFDYRPNFFCKARNTVGRGRYGGGGGGFGLVWWWCGGGSVVVRG